MIKTTQLQDLIFLAQAEIDGIDTPDDNNCKRAALAALERASKHAYWRPIEELPDEYKKKRGMFLVRALHVVGKSTVPYTTDPYAVFLTDLNGTEYARWPHPFPPTQFMEIPR